MLIITVASTVEWCVKLHKMFNAIGSNITERHIKTRIGSILFTIILDRSFFELIDCFDTEKHNHSDYEIHFIIKGSGSLKIKGKSSSISPNSYCIIAPGIYHEQNVDPANPIGKYCFRMEYKLQGMPEDFFPVEENSTILDILKRIEFFSSEDIHNNLSLIYEIRNELINQQIGYYSRIQALFSQVIINIIRDMASKQKTDYEIPERVFHEKRNLIIEDFFENNYTTGSSAHELAKLVHVSIRQLDRIMKGSFNMSFKQKMLEKRIEISKSLLKITKLPVKVVSEMVGYYTESNFCAIFKQKIGCTPTEYRNKNIT